jgi:hypothetical protein
MFGLLCLWGLPGASRNKEEEDSALLCSAKKMISSKHTQCGLPLISFSLLRQRRSKGSYRQRGGGSSVTSDHRLLSQPPLLAPRLQWHRTSAVLSGSTEAPTSPSALPPPYPLPCPHLTHLSTMSCSSPRSCAFPR